MEVIVTDTIAVLLAIMLLAAVLYGVTERQGLPVPLRWGIVGVWLFFSVGGVLGLVR